MRWRSGKETAALSRTTIPRMHFFILCLIVLSHGEIIQNLNPSHQNSSCLPSPSLWEPCSPSSLMLFWEHYINDILQRVTFKGGLFLLKKLSKLSISNISWIQSLHHHPALYSVTDVVSSVQERTVVLKTEARILWKASSVRCTTSFPPLSPTGLPTDLDSSDSTSMQNYPSFHATASSSEGDC